MSTGKTPRALVGVLACIASLSGLLFGYDASSINDALPLITDHFGLSQTMKGNVVCLSSVPLEGLCMSELILVRTDARVQVSVLLLGAVIGSLLAGFPADRWGRRPTILMSGVTFCVGCTVSSWLARNVALLILGRLIIGFAIGITSSVSPLYIAELVRACSLPTFSLWQRRPSLTHPPPAAYRHQQRIAAGW
jgi:MFS family permease